MTEGRLERTLPIRKMLTQSYLVMVFSSFVGVVGTLIDGILIGRYLGETSLAAMGLCVPLILIAVALAAAFSTGGQIIATRYVGRGDVKKANEYFSLTFFIILIYGILVCAFIFFFPDLTADLLGASKDPEVKAVTVSYLRGVAPGIPMTVFLMSMLPFVQLDGGRLSIVFGMVAMISLNVVGDVLNVFLFHQGMLGMGAATSISSGVALIILISHFFQKGSCFKISIRDVSFSRTGELFVTGAPTAMQRVYSAVANLLMNLIIVWIGGSVAVAANSAKSNFGTLLLLLGSAFAPTVVQLVSMLYGEDDIRGIEDLLKRALIRGVIISSTATLITLILGRSIMRIYLSGSPDTLDIATRALNMYAFVFPLSTVCDILSGYSQAMNNKLMSNLIPLLEYLLLPVLFSIVLGKFFIGTDGVWISFVIAEAVTLILIWLIRSLIIRRPVTNPLDISDYQKIGFVPEKDIYVKTIKVKQDAITASEEISKFCSDRTEDDKIPFIAALAVEELCFNLVDYGFEGMSEDKRYAEVRVVFKDGSFVLRIRDNGKRFDPKDYYEKLLSSKDSSHFGVRMICGMANDINYVNTLSYNNLIIKM